MRRFLLSAVAFGICCLIAGASAQAATTLSDAHFSLSIGTLPPIAISQTGSVQIADPSRDGGGNLLSVGFSDTVVSTTGFVAPVTDPAASPIRGVQVTAANGTADFSAGGGPQGGFGGTMNMIGQNKVCLFGPCSAAVANLNVPVSVVGVGGAGFVTAAVNLTVIGAPWTSMTAAIGSLSVMGAPVDHTVMGSALVDTVSLVTPIFVSTNIGPSAIVPVFGLFDFTVTTPEPTTAAVVGASVVALISIGLSRRRKS